MQVKVAYISNKPPLVGEHAFSLLVGSHYILVEAVRFDTFYVCSSIGICLAAKFVHYSLTVTLCPFVYLLS